MTPLPVLYQHALLLVQGTVAKHHSNLKYFNFQKKGPFFFFSHWLYGPKLQQTDNDTACYVNLPVHRFGFLCGSFSKILVGIALESSFLPSEFKIVHSRSNLSFLLLLSLMCVITSQFIFFLPNHEALRVLKKGCFFLHLFLACS